MHCTIMGSSILWRDVCEAYRLFDANGIDVLLPPKEVIESMEAYVSFDMGMQNMSRSGGLSPTAWQRLNEHLDAIKISDFLYVMNPHNDFSGIQTYATGYAHALYKPVYSRCRVENSPARAYVEIYSPQELVKFLKHSPKLTGHS